MIVAFFDFDGTITKKDSFLEFIAFTHGKPRLYAGIIRHIDQVIGYKLNLIPGHKIKETFLTHFYKGISENKFKELGARYCQIELKKIIHSGAVDRIQWHKKQEHKVVVVTASLSQWIQPWCNELGIDLISTEAEIIQDKVTGRLKEKNCNGAEKVVRIKKTLDLTSVSYTYAYGNSSGDKELLEIADEKFYRYF